MVTEFDPKEKLLAVVFSSLDALPKENPTLGSDDLTGFGATETKFLSSDSTIFEAGAGLSDLDGVKVCGSFDILFNPNEKPGFASG